MGRTCTVLCPPNCTANVAVRATRRGILAWTLVLAPVGPPPQDVCPPKGKSLRSPRFPTPPGLEQGSGARALLTFAHDKQVPTPLQQPAQQLLAQIGALAGPRVLADRNSIAMAHVEAGLLAADPYADGAVPPRVEVKNRPLRNVVSMASPAELRIARLHERLISETENRRAGGGGRGPPARSGRLSRKRGGPNGSRL